MKAQTRLKLQRAGFTIIRKYSATRGNDQLRVICRVSEKGKLHIFKRYGSKSIRDAAYEKMLEEDKYIGW